MTRLNELKQARIEARDAHAALLNAHLSASKAEARGFTDEEKQAQVAAEAKVKNLDEQIAAEEKVQDIEKERASRGPARIEVSKPNHVEDPRRGFRTPREFLGAVMKVGTRGVEAADERIRPLIVRDKDDEMAAGDPAVLLPLAFSPGGIRAAAGSDEQGVYDDRYGGALVPTTRLPGLLQVGFEGDPTAGATQSVPMQTPSVEMPARVDKDHTSSVSGGFTVTRRPETVAATSSRAQFERITLKAASLFGLAYATEEVITDSPQSFLAIIDRGFRDQFGAHMLNEKIRGGGGNEYLGVLNSPALVTVSAEAAQVADTIISDNVIKMAARCWGFGSAFWLANHDTRPQLIKLSIVVGTGGSLIYTPSATMGFPDMLLGRPIFYSEYSSKLGDVGDIILGNWSQFLEGTYQPLQSAESIHVRFLNHERTFKFWLRNAGAPWWRSALTPNKSGDTLSPFVTLAAR